MIKALMLLLYLKSKNIRSVCHLHFGRIPLIKAQNTREWKLFLKIADLASAVVAIPEMLDGNGWLCEPKNVEQLKESILIAINSEADRMQMSENLYKRVSDNYEISKVYDKYSEIWRCKINE